MAVDAVLNWRPGRKAASHEVYLGTDPNALSKVGTVTEHRYGLISAGLEYDRTYYWKVNEVNDAATPTTWEGDVWSFSTVGYAVVEDGTRRPQTRPQVPGVSARPRAQMQTANGFLDAGWDFMVSRPTVRTILVDRRRQGLSRLVVGVHVACFLAGPTEWLGRRDADLYPELARRGRGHRVRRILRQRPQPRGQCDERESRRLLRPTAGDVTTYDPPGLLAFGQTYYWRVDEVNAAPDSSSSGEGLELHGRALWLSGQHQGHGLQFQQCPDSA